MSTGNVTDLVTNTNTIIQENLSSLYEKISIMKSDLIDEEDNEYENFYNRINFYFSSIINQLKLNFLEGIKEHQKIQQNLKAQIDVMKKKIAQYEKDIMELIMENMLLKIENENYEEKNMLNISHYVDVNPEEINDKSTHSNNNPFFVQEQKLLSKKNKKTRNKSGINSTLNEDISFKTEVKNNINVKIKKKIISQSIIPHNHSGNEMKGKKSNLTNFLNHANFINTCQKTNHNMNSKQSITPSRNQPKGQIGQHQHYKSFTNDANSYTHINHHSNLTGEKSMYNLPSYSLGKLKNDNKMKSSLNDLNLGQGRGKVKYINVITTCTKNGRSKSGSSINIGMATNKKKATSLSNNRNNYNTTSSIGSNNDFEKYKTNLISKISTSGSGFGYLSGYNNLTGLVNLKLNHHNND